MAVVVQQHHIKAPTPPTWFLINVTPPPAPREGGRKAALASYSPLLLSPSGWKDEKKRNKDDDAAAAERADGGGGLPASPRITCMGQVKGRRRCKGRSSARGPAPPRDSRHRSAGSGGKVANLVLGLFGMRRNARTTSRACAKVRDVPRAGTASVPWSTRGVRRGEAVAAVGVFDPPLPVVRRPATDDSAPSLWERRRGGGRALEGLQLMT